MCVMISGDSGLHLVRYQVTTNSTLCAVVFVVHAVEKPQS